MNLSRNDRLAATLVTIATAAIYLVTMPRGISFWDCPEFVTTNHGLQIGHPPGAPFYQLLAHLFTLFASTPSEVALWSNLLSVVAGSAGALLLFLCLLRLLSTRAKERPRRIAAATGSLCFAFAHTTWASATESEVYALAVTMALLMLWCGLRHLDAPNRDEAARWLLLLALVTGLSLCVHEMCLLVLPAVALLVWERWRREREQGIPAARLPHWLRTLLTALLLFAMGLSPYLIIPIRAAAHPPINCGNPDNGRRLHAYLAREQYTHAPLYPRLWRHDKGKDLNASYWTEGDTSALGNARFLVGYQLGYMHLRYILHNYAGRFDDCQGLGSLQRGQAVTGIPPLDRILVGTGKEPPRSIAHGGHTEYYLLPLLLGLVGLFPSPRRSGWRLRAVPWMLFLFGGPLLGIYLNHPAYEPRERDYAYVLSLLAYAIWIGAGTARLSALAYRHEGAHDRHGRWVRRACTVVALLPLAVPLLMLSQNYRSHDRSRQHVPHDSAVALLTTCPKGSLLFTYGDNDTFPLWHSQQVEGHRRDVETHNINLIGYRRFWELSNAAHTKARPVILSHYAANALAPNLKGRLALAGYAYRLSPNPVRDTVDALPAWRRLMRDKLWHGERQPYHDQTERRFIDQYYADALLIASSLSEDGQDDMARQLLAKTLSELPNLDDLSLTTEGRLASTAMMLDMNERHIVTTHLGHRIREEREFFDGLSPRNRQYLKRTIDELSQAEECLANETEEGHPAIKADSMALN